MNGLHMLSRTAQGLYWMSRYIERAENIARLLDTGRRMDALPSTADDRASEWASIVIASGCESTYPHDLEEATAETVADHLVFDRDNPSSIASSFHAARENARAMRIAVTTEVWDAINLTWSQMRAMDTGAIRGGRFAPFLDWVKDRGFLIRGAAAASMLRDQGYGFIELGKHIERFDATARLLDVKYHVLLPSAEDVGGGLDHMQWVQLLRAANSLRAFRWQYRETVTPNGVVHFLVLNEANPRSLCHTVRQIEANLEGLTHALPAQQACLAAARQLGDQVHGRSVEDIIAVGLHEWLTQRIIDVNCIALGIADAYGFNGQIPDTLQVQEA